MARSILVTVVIMISFFVAIEASRELINITPRPKGKTLVKITNQLGGNTALTVHCKSKKHDLGLQTLAPNASWEFRFNPNAFLDRTLFFCLVQWPGSSRYFDAYDEARDRLRCLNDCEWNIHTDGPCDAFDSKVCFGWNP